MKAARFHGNKDLRVEEIPEPEAGNNQVKIKIAWCGICGSDLHEYLGGPSVCPKTPHPTTGDQLPITFGHEFSGTIVALGKGVDNNEYAIGRNVIVEPLLDCRRPDCLACTSGRRNVCTNLAILGFSGAGGLSGYVAVDVSCVHIVPDNIPLEIAACMEPLAVAWYAVKRANFKPGDTCLVVGSGPIGLFVLKVLKALGCGWVGVSEPAEVRRNKSVKLGTDLALDPRSCNVVAEVMKNTGGRGVDISFECAGSEAGLADAISATKPRGTIMNIAMWETSPRVNMMGLFMGERILTSTCCYTGIHKEVIEAVASGKIRGIEELITKKISIDNIVEEGFHSLINDKDNQIKILVHPGGASDPPKL